MSSKALCNFFIVITELKLSSQLHTTVLKFGRTDPNSRGVRKGEAFVTPMCEGRWPPSGLLCAALRPSVPSALGTKEGNLFCHNMARGLSTPHLFV